MTIYSEFSHKKIVIFHGYVSLPEDICWPQRGEYNIRWKNIWIVSKSVPWHHPPSLMHTRNKFQVYCFYRKLQINLIKRGCTIPFFLFWLCHSDVCCFNVQKIPSQGDSIFLSIWAFPPARNCSIRNCWLLTIKNKAIISGWWFGTWIWFFHILGIIIPSDSYFSEGFKPPTRFTSRININPFESWCLRQWSKQTLKWFSVRP